MASGLGSPWAGDDDVREHRRGVRDRDASDFRIRNGGRETRLKEQVRVSERVDRDVVRRRGNGLYESGLGRGRDDDGDRGVVRAPMVDELELFGIYRGRVSRIMDYGCFVQLLGVRDRKEGLVHVHNIASRRVVNAKDAVERDQEVW